jgi:hypothetical protein
MEKSSGPHFMMQHKQLLERGLHLLERGLHLLERGLA